MKKFDPIESFANLRHEFGEHGGVNMSVEASTTFTVIDPTTMPEIFQGHLGPGCRRLLPVRTAFQSDGLRPRAADRRLRGRTGRILHCQRPGRHRRDRDAALRYRRPRGRQPHRVRRHLRAAARLPAREGRVSRRHSWTCRTSSAVERTFTPRTKVLFCETVSNPTLRVADIPRLAETRAPAWREPGRGQHVHAPDRCADPAWRRCRRAQSHQVHERRQ